MCKSIQNTHTHTLHINGHFSRWTWVTQLPHQFSLLHLFLNWTSVWDRPERSTSSLTQSQQVFYLRPLGLIPSTSQNPGFNSQCHLCEPLVMWGRASAPPLRAAKIKSHCILAAPSPCLIHWTKQWLIVRDQPNSREKNVRFHGRVFKICQISWKIHGRSSRNSPKFHGPHSRTYFEVLKNVNAN